MLKLRRWRRRVRRLFSILVVSVLLLVIASAGAILAWRWMDPATTSFILQRKMSELMAGGAASDVQQQWVEWSAISRHMGLAVMNTDGKSDHFRGNSRPTRPSLGHCLVVSRT